MMLCMNEKYAMTKMKKKYIKPETEIWRVGYEGPKVTYMVSNLGHVKKNGELITPCKNNRGYYTLGYNFVHRAVAELFVPNPDNKSEIDHIDGDKHNNRADNLRWCAHNENINNSITKKRQSEARKQWHKEHPDALKGENNPMYGKKPEDYMTPEAIKEYRQKQSESMKGKNKGRHRVNHSDGTYHYEK